MRKCWIGMFVLLLVLCLCGCAVRMDAQSTGKVVYDAYGTKFEDELTADEMTAVADVLDGKWAEAAILGRPSCGFDENVAIIIDGRRLAMACDGCGTLWDVGTSRYIHISNAEQDVLEEIFTSRGGEFPCI